MDDVATLLRTAEASGMFTFERRTRHVLVRTLAGEAVTTVPLTPSDHRSLRNATASLRRAGLPRPADPKAERAARRARRQEHAVPAPPKTPAGPSPDRPAGKAEGPGSNSSLWTTQDAAAAARLAHAARRANTLARTREALAGPLPLTLAETAEQAGVSVDAVRGRLARLVETGDILARPLRAPGRGRARVYAVTPEQLDAVRPDEGAPATAKTAKAKTARAEPDAEPSVATAPPVPRVPAAVPELFEATGLVLDGGIVVRDENGGLYVCRRLVEQSRS